MHTYTHTHRHSHMGNDTWWIIRGPQSFSPFFIKHLDNESIQFVTDLLAGLLICLNFVGKSSRWTHTDNYIAVMWISPYVITRCLWTHTLNMPKLLLDLMLIYLYIYIVLSTRWICMGADGYWHNSTTTGKSTATASTNKFDRISTDWAAISAGQFKKNEQSTFSYYLRAMQLSLAESFVSLFSCEIVMLFLCYDSHFVIHDFTVQIASLSH